MQEWILRVLLLIVALIHLLPLAGVLGAERLSALYGVEISDPNLAILMRHRALLFGLLGAFIAWAAFAPVLRPAAFIGAFFSVAGFFWLAWSVGDYNAALRKVVVADIVAMAALLGAVLVYFLKPGNG